MPKFATKQVDLIRAIEIVEELYIDDKSQLKQFEKSIAHSTYKSELKILLKYIEHFANGNSIGGRLVILKGVTDGYMEYEFRTKHLRIYAIQQINKKVIILGGKKDKPDSMDNIEPFRLLKKRYLASLK